MGGFFMGLIWRKVWRDLWRNKLRTLLIVLATAVGVFALGLVFGMSGTIRARFTESHRASVAPHVILFTSRFDQDVVDATLREPGVADAEGEVRASFRWKLEEDVDWRDGQVIASENYKAQRMYLIDLLDGDWPTERTLAVERMSSAYFDLPMGTTILVEVGRRVHRLSVGGIVRHPWTPPPQIGLGDATFCVTPETVAWLTGQEKGFDTLKVRLESFSQEGANEAAERIQDRLERMGLGVGFYQIVDPKVHWAQEIMDAVLLILMVLGALSLGLSGFLIINMMNAITAQQVRQIGVMKAIGGKPGRVMRTYLGTALIYGLLSTLLAVPLGAVGAHLLAGWMLDMFNVLIGDFQVMPAAVGIQIAVGLVVPPLAALAPAIGGARITVRRAMSSHGMGIGFGNNWFDRLIGQIGSLPRPLALSLRNTFRRKGRVALTLLTLMLGGAMFTMVLSLDSSLSNTIDLMLGDWGFDVWINMDRLHRVARLVEVAESVPGVARAEVWGRGGAQLLLASGEELDVGVWGVPLDSQMFNPRIASGRDLVSQDRRAILLNSKIAADEGVQVGDEVELTIGDRESTWTVVGLILSVTNQQRDNYVPFDALAQETGNVDRGAILWVTSEKRDPETREKLIGDLRDALIAQDIETAETQERLIRNLREVFAARRIKTTDLQSADQVRQQSKGGFDIVTYLMLAMAILAAVVGSIGLMSTMSINVVERTREIGVMRATGAASSTIAGIFVVEGVLLGMLSWLLAVPLSYPGARVFSNVIGDIFFGVPLDFSYSVFGLLLWLLIVTVLSALASLWPALGATRISVRESLSYE
jgi:putative ABC transport system permease protein